MPIPPWLAPPDVIAAMSAGGRLGLGRAELAERGREANQRTDLGMAQLGADQAMAGARLHAATAQNALNLALHQSALEEERRRDEATQQAKAKAEAETERKDTAGEQLRQKSIDAFQQRTEATQKTALDRAEKMQDTAFKNERVKAAQQRLMEAEKFYHAAVLNGKGVDEAKQHLDEVRKEYDSLSGDYSDMPDMSGSLLPPVSNPMSVNPSLPFNLQLPSGVPSLPITPIDVSKDMGDSTSSGLQYSIKRK